MPSSFPINSMAVDLSGLREWMGGDGEFRKKERKGAKRYCTVR